MNGISRRVRRLAELVAVAGVAAATVLTTGGVAAAAPGSGDYDRHVTVNGQDREMLVHVPQSYDTRSGPVPLVVIYHGAGGNPDDFRHSTGWLAKSDREGFILAAPFATRCDDGTVAWNATFICHHGYGNGPNELDFADTVVNDIGANFTVDRHRVFAAGFSSGGFNSFLLALGRPGTFAAVAPAAGSIMRDISGALTPSSPVSVLGIHDVHDGAVCYDGCVTGIGDDILADGPPRSGVQRTTMQLLDDTSGHCAGGPTGSAAGNSGHTTLFRWQGCAAGGDLAFLETHSTATTHAWPGPGGGGDDDIDATDAAWNFFVSHPKP